MGDKYAHLHHRKKPRLTKEQIREKRKKRNQKRKEANKMVDGCH